jgi:AcrR family transcriptional regulator
MTLLPSPDNRRARGFATRERLLDAATAAFAAKGYYGASLRDIGGPLGLANASLLHHFAGKSALYAEVLTRIHDMLEDMARDVETGGGTVDLLYDALWDWLFDHPAEAQIVLREVIDNTARADRVDRWYLAAPMHRLAGVIVRGQRAGRYRPCDPIAFLFHMIGSISYLAAALPTVAGIAGQPREAFAATYRQETRQHLLRAIASGGTPDGMA